MHLISAVKLINRIQNKSLCLHNKYILVYIHIRSTQTIYYVGLGTDLGTFKGTYRFASVLQSIDSH